MSSNDIVIVQFDNAWQGYAAGEKAGFEKDKAEALEKGGFATILKKGGKAAQSGTPNSVADRTSVDQIPGGKSGRRNVPGGAGKAEKGKAPGDPNNRTDQDDETQPTDPVDLPVDPVDPVDPAPLNDEADDDRKP